MVVQLRDPRIIASLIAISCMLLDDLPGPQYGTFRDPGAAAMLSIILANTVTLIGRPRWGWVTWGALGIGLVLKFFLQAFFWVQNAWLWDTATLVLAHSALGFLALKAPVARRFVACGAASGAVIGSLFVLIFMGSPWSSWSSWLAFWLQLAAARILTPFAFWTAVLSTGASSTTSVTERKPT